MIPLVRGVLAILLALALLLVLAFAVMRSSLPRVRGETAVAGLVAPAELARDPAGVVHIRAGTLEDAYFALGFAHAQDRLWQMEFARRLGAGRLAEILGEDALEVDRFIRTLGVRHAAERDLAALSPRSLGALEAYCDGINAFLDSRRGLLPPEFLLLRHRPDPWTPTDVLVRVKLMAWDLAGNWRDELLRARLMRELPLERVRELWPAYPEDAPVVLEEVLRALRLLPLDALAESTPPGLPPGSGSNAWAVSGEHTLSGRPLLANDPHLSLEAPTLWYLVRLEAPGLDVLGATLPGTPAVLLGRTPRLAWGFTNTGSDLQDLYIERVDPQDPSRYAVPGGFRPFDTRVERIAVRGGEEVVIEVRETRHGPVISDVVGDARRVAETAAGPGEQFVLALRWTALEPEDRTLQAVLALPLAEDWEGFTRALSDFHAVQQNIVYADVDGDIGFIAPGRVPVRAGGRGWLPVPGWSERFDWTGFVPFDELPSVLNPPSGQIVSANHKIVGEDYPHHLTDDWEPPYRARRIHELLDASGSHTAEGFARMQLDVRSLMVDDFLALARNARAEGALERRAQALLIDWDGSMAYDSAAPLLFSAWYREFAHLVQRDELGSLLPDAFALRPLFLRSVIEGESQWCDDVRSPLPDGCEELAARALTEAVASIAERHGAEPDAWRWGDAHRAVHRHTVFSGTSFSSLFELTVPGDGGPFTVNAAPYRSSPFDEGFTQTSGAGYRAVYDLADGAPNLLLTSTGQSGNPLSGEYRSLLDNWRQGRPLAVGFEPPEEGQRVLRLVPRR